MIRDISPPLSPETDTWPGDTRFAAERVMDMSDGAAVNVTTIRTTVQLGAHIDAPLHFRVDGADAASVALDAYLGPARVARLATTGGVRRADLEALPLGGAARLLLHTRIDRGAARFARGFAWLEPEAARYLAGLGIRLFGIDSFSVDHPDSKTLESHNALLAAGVAILEGIVLDGVPEGDYELIALPLPLVGCDASPVRAVLRDLV